MENIINLYHTSSEEIQNPDVYYGRRNADFGGGFYLSDSREFATKWSSAKKSCVNYYTLDLTGLTVKRFEQSEEWFDYIAENRAGRKDKFADTDIIIGPIANDTLYDTYGIIFSGLISQQDALKLLSVGNKYTQINVKTEKAVKQLKWVSAQKLSDREINLSREKVKAEEAEFTKAFKSAIKELENSEFIEDIIS